MTLTLREAQQHLADAARQALQGEPVLITVGGETLRLTAEVPLRPAGYFAECYREPADAALEERLCRDSAPVVEP
jgi:antitoxin (DNA-binding transcriptional repressor) of toxin-antitoxin stability system